MFLIHFASFLLCVVYDKHLHTLAKETDYIKTKQKKPRIEFLS